MPFFNWKKKKEENIIILTLKELGVNIIELLVREQLYRQKKLPREVSDIIESNLVENARFVNALKRNIFTEKELSEKLREKILRIKNILEIGNLNDKYYNGIAELADKGSKITWEIYKLKGEIERMERRINIKYWWGEIEKEELIKEIILELENKERAQNIQKLEKEELEAVRKELTELSQSLTTKERGINNEISENVALRAQKAENGKKINQLEKEKNEWKEKYEKQVQQKRIGLIANVAQGAVEWLPIPVKWQEATKTSIQAVSMWALFKDLPNWTYEGFIMVTGIGLWYALLHLLRKINHLIFGRKEKRQISNLEQALTNIFEKGINQPAAISKEPVKPEEKTDPNITEKEEKEKPVQNGKKGKKTKRRKSKKKVKGDS